MEEDSSLLLGSVTSAADACRGASRDGPARTRFCPSRDTSRPQLGGSAGEGLAEGVREDEAEAVGAGDSAARAGDGAGARDGGPHASACVSLAHANGSAGYFHSCARSQALCSGRWPCLVLSTQRVHQQVPLQHGEKSGCSGLKAAQRQRHEPRLNTSAHTHSIRIPG